MVTRIGGILLEDLLGYKTVLVDRTSSSQSKNWASELSSGTFDIEFELIKKDIFAIATARAATCLSDIYVARLEEARQMARRRLVDADVAVDSALRL